MRSTISSTTHLFQIPAFKFRWALLTEQTAQTVVFKGGSFESIGLDEYGLRCQPLREEWHCLGHRGTCALSPVGFPTQQNRNPKKRPIWGGGFWMSSFFGYFPITIQVYSYYQLLQKHGLFAIICMPLLPLVKGTCHIEGC